MARPHASFPFVAIALGGAMYLANCGGDVQNAAPSANRPPSMTFTSGQTGDTTGAAGTFDSTGFGGYGGDFGTGGSDDDGSAGSGGEGTDDASRDGCATGDTDTFFLSDLNWIGTPVNGFGPVERDTSNGEMAAGDGHPMSIAG